MVFTQITGNRAVASVRMAGRFSEILANPRIILFQQSKFGPKKPVFCQKIPTHLFFILMKYKLFVILNVSVDFDDIKLNLSSYYRPMRHRGKESGFFMLKVKSRTGESVQQMMKRFKKLCEKEGLIRDMKRNTYYEKPSVKNRRRIRKAQRISSSQY